MVSTVDVHVATDCKLFGEKAHIVQDLFLAYQLGVHLPSLVV